MKRLVLVALCLAVCVPSLRAQSADEKKATVAYVQGLQAADGGFLPAAPKPADNKLSKSSLRSTPAALRALKYFDGAPKDPKAAAAFISKCFDKASGGFADFPGGKPDATTTAIGIIAVAEVKLPTKPFAGGVLKYLGENVKGYEEIRIAAAGVEALGKKGPEADVWLKELAKQRHDDGTYGRGDGAARETGGAAVAVLRLGGKLAHKENVVKTIEAGQRDDGAWGAEGAKGSDLGSSYRVMRCFHMLKERPANVDKLKGFIARCRNKDGGYGTAPGKESGASGTYYAGIILHWLEEK